MKGIEASTELLVKSKMFCKKKSYVNGQKKKTIITAGHTK